MPLPVPLGKGLTSWVIRNGLPLRRDPADFERLTRSGEIEILCSSAVKWNVEYLDTRLVIEPEFFCIFSHKAKGNVRC